ncbi:hypothetical protein MAMC_00430 [Methylacidimicrobium cyclopophantes]|uniref:VWFA domain-containing protein n=1 Tax=Methylacidimicrobium cyclopophantes TaxID=1041766 RepID=A0A5E6MBL8_9BACT|nr:VWA domain-containing protein [Methylacidimicrobium cyclopophantes]VVM05155.1 hypothetical protein MAMC_00430 [Methylacidimicrobium cyclopophantes]
MIWRSPLWLYLGLPLLAFALLLFWRTEARLSAGKSFLQLVPTEGRWAIRSGGQAIRRWPRFFVLAGLFVLFALARPQGGQSPRQLLRPSTDLILALDLSRSMTSPDLPPSRLDRAKLLIRAFLQQAQGQRVGLLVFSNSAQLAVPLTTDYGAIEGLLTELTPASLPEAGTDFTALLAEAYEAFSQSDAAEKVLLLLSDGEDHGSGSKERLSRLARLGVRIDAIGLGTSRGGMIPDPRGGFLKDEQGHPVLSHLESNPLRALASATGGRYFRGDRWVTLSEIFGFDSAAKGSRMEQAEGRAERFAYFLLPALLCWCAGLLWELPAFRSSSRTAPPPARPLAANSKVLLAFFLTLGGLWPLPCFSQARSAPNSSGAGGEEDKLVRCVQALAGKERLSASDYGALARETISWCRAGKEEGLSTGVIQDGLTAVDRGERLDPRLLPWEQMRKELQALLEAARAANAPSETSSSFSQNRGSSSLHSPRFRPSAAGHPSGNRRMDRQRPTPGSSEEKSSGSSAASPPGSLDRKDGAESEARRSLPEGQSGARARLHQVERLDRPAILFERMRQKEAEQADSPPELMDW